MTLREVNYISHAQTKLAYGATNLTDKTRKNNLSAKKTRKKIYYIGRSKTGTTIFTRSKVHYAPNENTSRMRNF